MTRTFTPYKIADLIAKLEGAPGPDRALDAIICAVLDLRPDWLKSIPKALVANVQAVAHVSAGKWGPGYSAPNFTASIDAALTLVPENHDWSLFADNGEAGAGCAPASEDGCAWADSHGATSALAFCIAALKARASIRASGARPTGSKPDEAPPNRVNGSVGRDCSSERG